MRPFYLCLGLCLLLGCEQSQQHAVNSNVAPDPQMFSYADYLTSLTKGHLTPGYAALADEAVALKVSLANMCEQPVSAEKIVTAQSQWKSLMRQWQSLQWFQLGPIQQDNRHARLQYWPDSNDAVERGTIRLLRTTHLPSLAQLANANVGAQGLPALERLLFKWSDDKEINQQRVCAILALIAANVVNISEQVNVEWQQQFTAHFTAGSGEFSGPKDAAEEAISNWLAQLIIILDNKISYPLSFKSPGIAQLAESHYADLSMQNLQQNLHTFQLIFSGADQHGLDDILLELGNADLANAIHSQLDKTLLLAASLPHSFIEALASQEDRKNLEELIQALRQLQTLLAVEMAAALELNLGFNALDGD